MGLFDLHVHSVASDGTHSLMQLSQLARHLRLTGLALTDHDCLPEPDTLANSSERFGVEWISGVELSTYWNERSLHLVGLGMDVRHPGLSAMCKQLQDHRRDRWDLMIAELGKRNIHLDHSRSTLLSGCRSIGRLHLARELVRSGHASDIRSVFWRYRDVMSVHGSIGLLSLERAIELLHEAGGVAVLAHPPQWVDENICRQFRDMGMDGLETRFPAARERRRRNLDALTLRFGMYSSAGSDFHGDDSHPWLGHHTLDERRLRQLLESTHHAAQMSSASA